MTDVLAAACGVEPTGYAGEYGGGAVGPGVGCEAGGGAYGEGRCGWDGPPELIGKAYGHNVDGPDMATPSTRRPAPTR